MVNNSKILAATKSSGLIAFVRQCLGKSRIEARSHCTRDKGMLYLAKTTTKYNSVQILDLPDDRWQFLSIFFFGMQHKWLCAVIWHTTLKI